VSNTVPTITFFSQFIGNFITFYTFYLSKCLLVCSDILAQILHQGGLQLDDDRSLLWVFHSRGSFFLMFSVFWMSLIDLPSLPHYLLYLVITAQWWCLHQGSGVVAVRQNLVGPSAFPIARNCWAISSTMRKLTHLFDSDSELDTWAGMSGLSGVPPATDCRPT